MKENFQDLVMLFLSKCSDNENQQKIISSVVNTKNETIIDIFSKNLDSKNIKVKIKIKKETRINIRDIIIVDI
jgi:pantothenate kinase type III